MSVIFHMSRAISPCKINKVFSISFFENSSASTPPFAGSRPISCRLNDPSLDSASKTTLKLREAALSVRGWVTPHLAPARYHLSHDVRKQTPISLRREPQWTSRPAQTLMNGQPCEITLQLRIILYLNEIV